MTVKIGNVEIGPYINGPDRVTESLLTICEWVFRNHKGRTSDTLLTIHDTPVTWSLIADACLDLRHNKSLDLMSALKVVTESGWWPSTLLAPREVVNTAFGRICGDQGLMLYDLALRLAYSSVPGTNLDIHSSASRDGWKTLLLDYDHTWRFRELFRFAVGHYTPVPWAQSLPAMPGHYVHMSRDNDGMIAFTENDAKGERDIQIRTKPGRYLTRFYPHLDTKEVQRYAAMVTGSITTLRFAATPEHIELVYVNGPSSCMSYPKSNFSARYQGEAVHPVIVYGNSDVQIAYLGNEDGTNVSARAICWPEKKRYGRCYGDEYKLVQALQGAGYQSGSMSGAKIRRLVMGGDRLVMPYIDSCQSFDVYDDKWCCIDGDYPANRTDGTAFEEPEGDPCPRCDERSDTDDWSYVRDHDESWCYSCCESHTWRCDYTGDLFSDGTASYEVRVSRRSSGRFVTETWNENAYEDHAFTCDGDGAVYDGRNFSSYEMEHGETWGEVYFADNGIEVDGVYYRIGDEPKDDDTDQEELPFNCENAEAAAVPVIGTP